MAKLILRDNLTGSIDVSHCVHCILAGFLSGEAGGAFAPPWLWLAPSCSACQLIQVFIASDIHYCGWSSLVFTLILH